MQEWPILYKRTKTGAIQEWHQIVNGDSWCSVSGQMEGAKVTSGWHKCFPKNIGKKNATTAEEQAVAEVDANYTKRQEIGYFQNVSEIDNDIYFQPMLAKKFEDRKAKLNFQDGVFSDPKLDGMRCIITQEGMFSRNGKKIPSAPHVLDYMNEQGYWDEDDSLVYDGELYNHDLRDNFDELMSLARKTKPTKEDLQKSEQWLQFHCYDKYSAENDYNFERRVEHDDPVFAENPYIFKVKSTKVNSFDEIDNLFDEYLEAGYEGQMIRTNDVYENKRSNFLLKRKDFIDKEFKVIAIVEGIGNRAGMAGRITLVMKDGREFGAGIKGTHEYSKQLLDEKQKYISGEATIRYFCLTPDGFPRFPVAVYLYEGKKNT